MADFDPQAFKTDQEALDRVLSDYDIDAALEAEFNQLHKRYQTLQIVYQILLKTRSVQDAQND